MKERTTESLPDWKAADLHGRVPPDRVFSGQGLRRAMGRLREEVRTLTGLGDLIESNEYDLVRIQRDWSKLAGPLAAFSYPARFKGDSADTLEIIVENAAYAQELSLYSREVIRKMKEFGFGVNRLRTKQGRLPYDRMNQNGRSATAVGRSPSSGRSHENPGLDGLLDGLAGNTDPRP